MRHHQGVVLDLVEKPVRVEVSDHLLARVEAVEAAIGSGTASLSRASRVEDVDHRQPVAAADLEIVEVVGRGDLDRTAAGFRVGVFVGDDRDQPADERQPHRLADEIGVALVIGMNGDAGVAEHRLGPRRRDGDEPAGKLRHRIADMPQEALGLAALDLEIGDHRVHLRVPVDEPLVAVDQPLAIERDKDPAHRGGEARVHRKALAPPVGRGAEPAQLAGDRAAGLLLPLPDAGDEFLAAEIALCHARLGELAGDHDLRGDAGMVGAGLPQHVAAAHALIADQQVLQREGQRVAHMQAARHVGRRHHYRVRREVAVGVGRECARAFP